MPRSSGYFKGVFRGAGGSITNHADLELISLAPQQALAVQGLMATAALRAAIQEVQKAVERVEGKVDDLVALTKATTIAGVVGNHRLLAEYVDRMDRTGARPRRRLGHGRRAWARTREGDRRSSSLCAWPRRQARPLAGRQGTRQAAARNGGRFPTWRGAASC